MVKNQREQKEGVTKERKGVGDLAVKYMQDKIVIQQLKT